MNLTTKEGTNKFHGSGWEFNRLSAYTANTFENVVTDTPKGTYTRNQFGFDIVGTDQARQALLRKLRMDAGAKRSVGIRVDPHTRISRVYRAQCPVLLQRIWPHPIRHCQYARAVRTSA